MSKASQGSAARLLYLDPVRKEVRLGSVPWSHGDVLSLLGFPHGVARHVLPGGLLAISAEPGEGLPSFKIGATELHGLALVGLRDKYEPAPRNLHERAGISGLPNEAATLDAVTAALEWAAAPDPRSPDVLALRAYLRAMEQAAFDAGSGGVWRVWGERRGEAPRFRNVPLGYTQALERTCLDFYDAELSVSVPWTLFELRPDELQSETPALAVLALVSEKLPAGVEPGFALHVPGADPLRGVPVAPFADNLGRQAKAWSTSIDRRVPVAGLAPVGAAARVSFERLTGGPTE